jgi:hypothetical protein
MLATVNGLVIKYLVVSKPFVAAEVTVGADTVSLKFKLGLFVLFAGLLGDLNRSFCFNLVISTTDVLPEIVSYLSCSNLKFEFSNYFLCYFFVDLS